MCVREGFNLISADASQSSFAQEILAGCTKLAIKELPLPLCAVMFEGRIKLNFKIVATLLYSPFLDGSRLIS